MNKKNELRVFGGIFDPDRNKLRIEELDHLSTAPGFWDNGEKAQGLMRERTALIDDIELAEKFDEYVEEIELYREMTSDGEEVEKDYRLCLKAFYSLIAETELRMMLSEPHDKANAILTIHPGAGGTESQDWASMLYRMYCRYGERNGFKIKILEYMDGDEAGIKSATLYLEGLYAYGYLKAESGVHRLVRISPFDSAKRRHTSFTSVFVTPEIENDDEVVIEDKELRIDTYRASGAGGQHINKTDSAIRITHLPSGIVVQCQNERSQHKNKASAMKVLRSRLAQLQEEERRKEMEEVAEDKMEIGWGSQIRSYVLHPYQMVKDHRTNEETGSPDKVLDGDLKDFIRAYLLQRGNDD